MITFEQLEKHINKKSSAIFLPVKKGRRPAVALEFWPAWKIKEILENEIKKTPTGVR